MNRDEIIAMAREAHHTLVTHDYPGHLGQLNPWTLQLLTRFAALVAAKAAAKEREACAQVCDAKAHEVRLWCNESNVIDCATAIRARGRP